MTADPCWGLRPNLDSQINEIIIQNFNCSVFRKTLSILLLAAYIMRSVHTDTHALCGWGSGPMSWGQLVFKKCVAVGGGVRVWQWVNERLTMTNSHWLLPSLLINGIKPITTHSFIHPPLPLKPCWLLFISHCALSRRVTRDHSCLYKSQNAVLLEYVNNNHPRPYANKQLPSSRIHN